MIINLWVALKYSKYLFSPPILMGVGLLMASLVATLYYRDWELEDFSHVSTICIGCGTIIFTLSCYFFRIKLPKVDKHVTCITLNKKRCLGVIVLGIIVALYLIWKKQSFYEGRIGGDFSEMVFLIRTADSDDNFLKLPRYLLTLNTFNSLLCLYIYMILSCAITYRWGKLSYLLGGFYFLLMIYDGLLTGAKGNIIMPFVFCGTMLLYMTYVKKKIIRLNFKNVFVSFAVIFIFLGCFKFIASLIGRESQSDVSNIDLVAEYLGAEIKNFDLQIQGFASNVQSSNFLGYTLRKLYNDLGINNPTSYDFLSIGNKSLGNVYTQYYCYYMDLGIMGCILLPILTAAFCMLLYNMMLKSMDKGKIFSLGLFWYSLISYGIIMSFFDAYILGSINISFIRANIIYLGISYFIVTPFLIKKNNRAV